MSTTVASAPPHQPGPHGLAVLGLTVLSTSTGGALVAVLNFVAQKALRTSAVWPLLTGIGLLGVALVLTVAAALAAYLSQLIYSQGRRSLFQWWVAFGLAIFAVLTLTAALGWCYLRVIVQAK